MMVETGPTNRSWLEAQRICTLQVCIVRVCYWPCVEQSCLTVIPQNRGVVRLFQYLWKLWPPTCLLTMLLLLSLWLQIRQHLIRPHCQRSVKGDCVCALVSVFFTKGVPYCGPSKLLVRVWVVLCASFFFSWAVANSYCPNRVWLQGFWRKQGE